MRRVLFVPPLALLMSAAPACAPMLATPSMASGDWSEPPTQHDAVLPARADALSAWTVPASSPWAAYAKYTLLTALSESSEHADLPDVEALDDVREAHTVGEHVGAAGLPDDAMWIVDMRGAASVAFGQGLALGARAGLVTLIPTFNNWPADREVIPAEETLAAMIAMAPWWQSGPSDGAQPVFLLDAWRMASRGDEPDDEAYDNRYMLSPSDLPDAATLRSRGIQRVVYVVPSLSDASLEEDDVQAAFLEWQAAGLSISMVDVATLDRLSRRRPDDADPIADTEWDDLLASRLFVVEPRATVVDDVSFYARARGGFGGIQARPFRMGGMAGGGGRFGAHGGGG